jgi:hypothetical protein
MNPANDNVTTSRYALFHKMLWCSAHSACILVSLVAKTNRRQEYKLHSYISQTNEYYSSWMILLQLVAALIHSYQHVVSLWRLSPDEDTRIDASASSGRERN